MQTAAVTGYLHPLHRLRGVVGDVDVDTDGLTVVIQLQGDTDAERCLYPSDPTAQQHECVTSLSREASRCRGLSDSRKLRLVSTIGCGPGFSGAYWTFRINRCTEFLHTDRKFVS